MDYSQTIVGFLTINMELTQMVGFATLFRPYSHHGGWYQIFRIRPLYPTQVGIQTTSKAAIHCWLYPKDIHQILSGSLIFPATTLPILGIYHIWYQENPGIPVNIVEIPLWTFILLTHYFYTIFTLYILVNNLFSGITPGNLTTDIEHGPFKFVALPTKDGDFTHL